MSEDRLTEADEWAQQWEEILRNFIEHASEGDLTQFADSPEFRDLIEKFRKQVASLWRDWKSKQASSPRDDAAAPKSATGGDGARRGGNRRASRSRGAGESAATRASGKASDSCPSDQARLLDWEKSAKDEDTREAGEREKLALSSTEAKPDASSPPTPGKTSPALADKPLSPTENGTAEEARTDDEPPIALDAASAGGGPGVTSLAEPPETSPPVTTDFQPSGPDVEAGKPSAGDKPPSRQEDTTKGAIDAPERRPDETASVVPSPSNEAEAQLSPGQQSVESPDAPPPAKRHPAVNPSPYANTKSGEFAQVSSAQPVGPPRKLPDFRVNLPNASVGIDYETRLEVDGEDSVKIVRIEGLDGLGLTFDAASCIVKGLPTEKGEHELQVIYRRPPHSESEDRLSYQLIVNADPKTLWNDIPSVREGTLFWKEDADHCGCDGIDGWLIAGASRRGRSHANKGTCRDDDMTARIETASGWQIMAVADGGGAYRFSRFGSLLAVNQSTEVLSKELNARDEDITRRLCEWNEERTEERSEALRGVLYNAFSKAVYAVIKAIHVEAENQTGAKFSDFYTTLLLAAHKPVAGGHLVAGYWRGDGGLVIYDRRSGVKLLGEPDSGEFAGQVRFLDYDARDKSDLLTGLRFEYQENMTALVLMTDGITDPHFGTESKLQSKEHWDKFWGQTLAPLLSDDPEITSEKLLDWLNFWSLGEHDDRTIMLTYHREDST